LSNDLLEANSNAHLVHYITTCRTNCKFPDVNYATLHWYQNTAVASQNSQSKQPDKLNRNRKIKGKSESDSLLHHPVIQRLSGTNGQLAGQP
jgi:hypothetical protein